MARYTATTETLPAALSEIVVSELDQHYCRETVDLVVSADLSAGTILELLATSGSGGTTYSWDVASTGSGRLAVLLENVSSASGSQSVLVEARGAELNWANLTVSSGIADTAKRNLAANGFKLI